MNVNENIVKSSLIGFAVGDAFGVPVEFLYRDKVRSFNLTEMVGCDRNPIDSRWSNMIPVGAWSDDTAMTVATMDAFIKDDGEFKDKTIMDNYLLWIRENEFTAHGIAFGLGLIVSRSLDTYIRTSDPSNSGKNGFYDNGNGSLMRILPHSLYAIKNEMSEEETVSFIKHASSLTHAHDISNMGCFIYTEFLRIIIKEKNKEKAFNHIINIDYNKYFSEDVINNYSHILTKEFLKKEDIESKENGYIVDTLEAVLLSIMKKDNFEETIIYSVNFGYDTDTIAGITGSIAGALYGYEGIPKRWTDYLKRLDYLIELSKEFYKKLNK